MTPNRGAIFREAVTAFAEAQHKPAPEGPAPSLAAPPYKRVLYVHAAALAAVEGREVKADALMKDTLGAQLVLWADELFERIAAHGYRAIRFDHRDVGLSTYIDAPVPDVLGLMVRYLLGLPIRAAYTLADMADDAAGLLAGLGVDRAHVVGVSMGGMIGQELALRHPAVVRSLLSISSTPGGKPYMLPKPRGLRVLLSALPSSRRAAQEHAATFFRTIGGTLHPPDLDGVRAMAGRSFDRAQHPQGFARHMAAILASGDRRARLRALRLPATVLHGSVDPLVWPAAGRATARAIPGARLRVVEGMGHDLPKSTWPILLEELDLLAKRAGDSPRASALEPRGAAADL